MSVIGSLRTAASLLLVLVLVLASLACSSPVGVRMGNPREIQRYLTRSALTGDGASDFSQNELRRYDLLETYRKQPIVALANLHGAARAEGFPPQALFALAELSFLHAERTKSQSDYAAALTYAWALLFPETGKTPLGPLDPRARIAADLYNRALTAAFKRTPGGLLALKHLNDFELGLPFGKASVSVRPEIFQIADHEYYDLRPVTELQVSGLRNRYRHPGIGAPLGARAKPLPGVTPVVRLDPSDLVPLTAVVVIDRPMEGLDTGRIDAHIEIFASLDSLTFENAAGRTIPLESEPSAALAASLAESRFWKTELQTFLGNAIGVRKKSALHAIRPYLRGRIPVVFVHGTASSPARWADMINDLLADPRLRERYAYWTFTYDSGNPIAYSGWQLRRALTETVAQGDPDGIDPCLQDMVVLGHSQGGLLTKLTAIDSGDRFWKNISSDRFEDLEIAPKTRELLQQTMFVEPLPFVTEVMFLATPHRGSYLAGPQIVRRIAEHFVRLPSELVRVGADLVTLLPSGSAGLTFNRIPTSIDNMSPGNPYIQTLSKIPVSPRIKAHSIISVTNVNASRKTAGDGVVKYRSAHVEGVESEVVVESPHSGMQAAPQTIEEVRRILLAHSAASKCPLPAPSATRLRSAMAP
ncbi:MAG: alpha/beta fold hydrolase [Myxococcota bacterium]